MSRNTRTFRQMSRFRSDYAGGHGTTAMAIATREPSEALDAAIEPVAPGIETGAAESRSGRDEPDYRRGVSRKPQEFSPRSAIVAAALSAATTGRMHRDLRGPKAAAFVIQVPSTAWVKPLESHLRELDDKLLTIAREGSNRTRDRSSVGNDEVATALSRGRRVVGIAVNPGAMLPSTLVTTADHVVQLATPNGHVIRDAMRRCYGRGVPNTIDDSVVAGLELEDLVAVMRHGSRPSDVIMRLRNAARLRNNIGGQERLPKLETAIEYGAARDWGRTLAQDFADYRAGKITWAECSRGAVLHSDPGLGKSLFARILANACQVPIIISSVAELFASSAGHLDDVIKAQRAVFARASTLAPCILFIDELDSIPNRATLSPRGADWWTPVINDFLLLLDSAVAGQREGVLVLGATNRIHAVDNAILRPGRLERAIHIPRPDAAGICNILRHHLDTDLEGADLSGFAVMLAGATGADIMLAVRNARRTARQTGRPMTNDDLICAIMPPETLPPAALRRMTIHESAHVVATQATGVGRIVFCRVQSQGPEGGRTSINYNQDDYLTASVIEDRVVVILAGRVAERVLLGAESDGSGGFDDSDLGRATAKIAAMHISEGLGGQLVYRGDQSRALREICRDRNLRVTVERHLQELHCRAEIIVRRHRDAIAAIAAELAVKRFLSGAAIEAIMAQFQPIPRPPGIVTRLTRHLSTKRNR
jgi:cell division protease FtsH